MNLFEIYAKKLKKFDFNYYSSRKNYEIASAISALNTAYLVLDAFNKDEEGLQEEDYVLRLYAILQSLFVSIDALYEMSYAIAGSKNFININNNSNLRNIRYIRNNVVGHPANRQIGTDEISYCILDSKRVTKNFFTYNIYTKTQTKTNTVDINEIISSYEKEAIEFLDEIYNVSLKYNFTGEVKDLIREVLNSYYKNGHFINELNLFIDRYKYEYPSAKKEQHRIIWRYDLVMKLDAISNNNDSLNEVIKYCIGLELNKMYKHIFGKDYPNKEKFPLPSMILSLYRFFNRNPEYIPYISHLKNYDDPLFFESLKEVYEGVSLKKMQGAMDYLGFLITLYMGNQSDMIYAMALPISEYRIK